MPTAVKRYRDASIFSPEHFTPVPLAGSERGRAQLVCFEPGQFIPVHRPGVDLALAVLEGEGTLVAGAEEIAVGPGTVAYVQAGDARGLRASTRLVLFTVVTPPPTAADHTEVAAGLARGTWR